MLCSRCTRLLLTESGKPVALVLAWRTWRVCDRWLGWCCGRVQIGRYMCAWWAELVAARGRQTPAALSFDGTPWWKVVAVFGSCLALPYISGARSVQQVWVAREFEDKI